MPTQNSKRISARLAKVIEPFYIKFVKEISRLDLIQIVITHMTEGGKTINECVLLGGPMKNLDILPISPFRGVSFHKSTQRWRCRLKVDQKCIHLGYFASDLEAAAHYNVEATKHFGNRAVLNSLSVQAVNDDKVVASLVTNIEIPGRCTVIINDTKDSIRKRPRAEAGGEEEFASVQKQASVDWSFVCQVLSDDEDDISIPTPKEIETDEPYSFAALMLEHL